MSNENAETGGGWRPEKSGDTIEGKIVDISTGDGGYGPYPIVTLNTDTGERAVHAFHQVLRTELARRRPKIGDKIAITYQGKTQPRDPNARPYHAYRVTGDGQVQGYDWTRDVPDTDLAGTTDEPQSDIPADIPAADPDLASTPAVQDNDPVPF